MTAHIQPAATVPDGLIQLFRPIPVGSVRLLVFDLDGTLADTAQDLCNSVNATLRRFGRRALPEKLIARFVGSGMPMLLRRALAASSGIPIGEMSEDVFGPMYTFCLSYYLEHDLDHTRAYTGVPESLKFLSLAPGATRTLAVLTNKPVRPAYEILRGLDIARYFWRICGGDSFSVKKPDPAGLRMLMEQARVDPGETVMIGDSKTDVQTARNAGAWIVGCNFGYGPQNLMEDPPDVLVTSAKAWTAVLNPAE